MKGTTKKTKCIAIMFALMFSLFGCASSTSLLPTGWRVPTVEETPYDIPIREQGPNRYLFTEADFDGDGKIDVARILVNDDKATLGLFVFLGSSEVITLSEIDRLEWTVRVMGVSKLEKGEYKTACGKGYWECKGGNEPVLTLKRPAINFFQLESASSVFVWDDASNSFQRIWMSD